MQSGTAIQYLFAKRDVREIFAKISPYAANDVDEIDEAELLANSVGSMADAILAAYQTLVPTLNDSKSAITLEPSTKRVQWEDHFGRSGVRDESWFTFHVPYTGEKEFFNSRPTTASLSPPLGTVADDELLIEFSGAELSAEQIQIQLAQNIASIKQYLEWLKGDVDAGFRSLHTQVEALIVARSLRVAEAKAKVAKLGFRIHRREDAPRFAVPVRRKEIAIKPPRSPSTSSLAEPFLDDQVYEDILKVLESMGILIERNPTTFARIPEEVLRDHFLLQLNGQFEGAATGETFNASGKTDVLIRENNRNIFIAECKYWNGAKSLTEAIDQLFGYLTWRDSKAALIVFSRNRNFSRVVEEAGNAFRTHPQFRAIKPYPSESGFRGVFARIDDEDRSIMVTAMIFNVPDAGA
jgi:hypothetical protein